jgi:SAM-dependent methyltransferase
MSIKLGACAVCGARTGRAVTQENGFTLLQCGCGAMFLDRCPPVDYVDPAYDPHPEDYYALPARLRLGFLGAHAPSGVLLEVGCGRGGLLTAAHHLGYQVAGVEVDRERARAASARLGVEIEWARVEDSARPDSSCDVVFHCDLLSHFPDPLAALKRMRRMLRPNGKMVFEVGLVAGGPAQWYQGPLRLPHHRWFFDEPALRRLLAAAGFQVVALRRFGLAPVTLLSRLAGAVGVGGGATRLKVYSPQLGRHLTLKGQTLVPEVTPQGLGATLRGRLYTFARYRLGRLVPTLGPGTAFVAAAPF